MGFTVRGVEKRGRVGSSDEEEEAGVDGVEEAGSP
jgi:hypothetical protein